MMNRLGRTLAAIGPHARDIWQDILGVALLRLILMCGCCSMT